MGSEKSGQSGWSRLLTGLFLVSIAIGAWARLKGLGEASLAVDEYYLVEAVRNIQRVGVPEWLCGGYYTRGLVHQYLSAALLSTGMFSGEIAIRLPSVLAGVATVVGGYLLALRIGGRNIALIVGMILCVSLWEVEYARFGRMYALYQALTVFYALVAVEFLDEGKRKSFWWMLALGGIGVLSHEGGILLVAFTIIAALIRPRDLSVAQLFAGVALLVAAAIFLVTDFRFMGVQNQYSEVLLATVTDSQGDAGIVDLPRLFPLSFVLRIVLLLFACAATAWLARRYCSGRERSVWTRILATCVLAAFFISLALQLYLFAVLLCACALTLRLLEWQVIVRGDFRWPAIATVVVLVGGGAAGAMLGTESAGTGAGEGVVALLKAGLRYPDFFLKVWAPWKGIFPVLGAAVLVIAILATGVALSGKRRDAGRRAYVLLFGIVLTLLAGMAIAHQPYYATRYTFFLYPLCIVLLAQGAVILAERFATGRVATALPFFLVGTVYLVSGDFNLSHLSRVDEPEFLYRTGYGVEEQEHLNRRWDFRSVADVINAEARPEDVVISAVYPVLPYYSDRVDIAYLDRSSQRIWAVSGCGGDRDLWSNLPLKFDPDDLRRTIVDATVPVWIVVMTDRHPAQTAIEAELLSKYAGSEVFRSIDGYLALLRIPRA